MNCNECGVELILGDIWPEFLMRGSLYLCRVCYNKRQLVYGKNYYERFPFKAKVRDLASKCPGQITVEQLKEIWEIQEGLCAICGCELDSVREAHTDHILPKKRGGITSVDNIQFLCKKCNMGKWDYSQDEYIEHCKKVVENN